MRTALRQVLGDLWQTFFVTPVRENALRMEGGPTARSMVWLGISAFAVAVMGVVLAPQVGSTPIAAGRAALPDPVPGVTATVPAYVFPVAVTLLATTVFLALFGAVYARGALAWLAVAFVVLTVTPIAGFAWQVRELSRPGYVSLVVTAGLPLAVGVLRRVQPSPPVAQAVAAALAVLTVIPPAWALTSTGTEPGIGNGVAQLANQLHLIAATLAALVVPVVLIAGAGAVSFGRTVTDFLARCVATLGGRRLLPFLAVVAVLLLWRVVVSVAELVDSEDTVPDLAKTALLVGLFGVAAVWWTWATRGFDETPDEVEAGSSPGTVPLALLVLAVPVFLVGVSSQLLTTELVVFETSRTRGLFTWTLEVAGDETVTAWAVVLPCLAVAGAAAWWARRNPSVVAAWAGVAATIAAMTMAWGTWVDSFAWSSPVKADYARAALVVVTLATVWMLVRWRFRGLVPSPGWALTAFSALALTALVAQESFLEDPFRPLLGFTGAGLVFFGVVWGFLTTGAYSTATGLAGLGRTTVMLAYAVLTALLVAWGDAEGGVVAETLSGPFSRAGQAIFGNALLVSLLAVWVPILFGITQPAVRRPTPPAPPAPPAPPGRVPGAAL